MHLDQELRRESYWGIRRPIRAEINSTIDELVNVLDESSNAEMLDLGSSNQWELFKW